MNINYLHRIGLLSCFSYLIGNIAFDIMDSPEYPANPNIFYIPLGVMTFCLILIIWEYSKKNILFNSRPLVSIFDVIN